MQIQLEIPEDIARLLAGTETGVSRAAMEALRWKAFVLGN